MRNLRTRIVRIVVKKPKFSPLERRGGGVAGTNRVTAKAGGRGV